MMEEEDRKIEEMRRKKSNREYWDYLKGPEDREQKNLFRKTAQYFLDTLHI